MQNTFISFIGGGHLARALVSGLVVNHHDPQQIMVANRTEDKLEFFKNTLGTQVTQNNCEAAKRANVIVLAVKPRDLQAVCHEIRDIVKERQVLVISVAAGVSVDSIVKWLGSNAAVVRTMPNVAAAVNASATGLFANANVSESQHEIAEMIFRAIGVISWCDKESLLDVIVAVAGSGPAYFFLFMEAMHDAAVQMGLSEEMSRLLIEQTALGAAKYALESSLSLHDLCQSVASPKGTTEQALNVMEESKLREIMAKAMQAASKRSKEIAKEYSS